ncbi:MAG TPA: hypothetical protein PK089_04700 [Methanoregulaceae archaeon]|nr:hypothetical protein [Methanoregulaceae archaeon]HOV68022.1 hypothetical protein [Methanoregulaceae archaeon]HQJ87291.1 hypothetical protein [Methanoregulaceae archaeon]
MAEQRGRFVKGRWVEEPEGPGSTGGPSLEDASETREGAGDTAESRFEAEELIAQATSSVARAVDDVLRAAQHLIVTREGHQYIESQVNRAGSALSDVLRELTSRLDLKNR